MKRNLKKKNLALSLVPEMEHTIKYELPIIPPLRHWVLLTLVKCCCSFIGHIFTIHSLFFKTILLKV
jgi:hypothetical protein